MTTIDVPFLPGRITPGGHSFSFLMHPKITVTDARNIIGHSRKRSSDQQLQRVLDLLYTLALMAYQQHQTGVFDIPHRNDDDGT